MKPQFLSERKLLTIVFTLFILTSITQAQFSSVKDGNWRDASTWSTDPNATAYPDSTSSVSVSHNVVASSSGYYPAECYDLTIEVGGVIDAYTSEAVSGSLTIRNDLINNGTIRPGYNFWLEIGGNLYNNGIITKHYISQYQRLYIMGDIYNNGSFHFTHTTFSNMMFTPNKTEHLHYIKSMNDSTINLGEVRFVDSLGSLIVDSVAIIGGQINLAGSKIMLPSANPYPNNLVLVNAQIFAGKIEANNNTISTQSGAIAYLGNIYGPGKNTVFSNANLNGTFISGGNWTDNGSERMVIFKGETRFEGNFADWYNGNVWYNGDRGIFIDGTFINNGNIYDATTDKGLFLNQKDNSTFISNGTVNNKAISFTGTCNFSVSDSISATQFKATDSNAVVNITQGDIFFKKTVTVDFNGGTLNLESGSKFYTTYQWYNRMQNILINANGGEIRFASINNDVVINSPTVSGVYYITNSSLNGEITVPSYGYIFPYSGYNPHVIIDGNLSNYGRIENHQSSGSLYLEITGNIIHDGISWKNIETKLNGTKDHSILIPNDSSWAGKVVLDAMIEGTNFKWQKDGIDISDAASKEYSFNAGIQQSNYGLYQCLVDGNYSRKIFIGNQLPSAFEITDVVISNLSGTQTKIEWKTTVPASGFIFYAENDTTDGYPLEAIEPNGYLLEHSLILENLTNGSTYYFIIDQNDEQWNNIRSIPYSFVAGGTGVGTDETELPREFILSQNYPNPFNPTTTIEFTLAGDGLTTLKVYDILGREVATLVNEELRAGILHQASLNSPQLSSGMYFYRLECGKQTQVKKLLLMK